MNISIVTSRRIVPKQLTLPIFSSSLISSFLICHVSLMIGVVRIAPDLLVTAVLDLCCCIMSSCIVECDEPSNLQPA